MMRTLIAASAILALAACGGSGTPTGPSPSPSSSTSPSQTSATISGKVAGATSAQLFNSTGAAAGITVTIVGTSLSSTVNGLGQFVLTNVPVGTAIVLRFDGAGTSAQLPVGTLGAGETLTITVTVSGNTAAIDSQARGNGSEIEGRIESIQPGTLVVASRTVTVGPATTIRHGSTPVAFDALVVGMRVHVKGTPSGTGTSATTAATQILVQNMNTSTPIHLEGTVSGLTGTAGAFQFTLEGRAVKGTSSTEFKGGKSPSFASLANGGKAEVKGTLQDGFVLAQRINLHDQNDDDDADEFEARGAVAGLSGVCPVISLTLNGTTVRSNPSTKFKGATCASIANGTTIEVEGIRQADGSVVATEIEGNEDDADDADDDDQDDDAGDFEAHGAISSLSGACPAITFTLNDVTIRATSSTKFEHLDCPAVANGTKVTVEGAKQLDGSVIAHEIKKG